MYGLFLPAAQGLYLLVAFPLPRGLGRGPGLATWMPVGAALVLLYTPGLVFLGEQMSNPRGRMWVSEPGPNLLARLPEIYADSATMAGLIGGWASRPCWQPSHPDVDPSPAACRLRARHTC